MLTIDPRPAAPDRCGSAIRAATRRRQPLPAPAAPSRTQALTLQGEVTPLEGGGGGDVPLVDIDEVLDCVVTESLESARSEVRGGAYAAVMLRDALERRTSGSNCDNKQRSNEGPPGSRPSRSNGPVGRH